MTDASVSADDRRKVLVVDDTPENIRILIEVLKDEYSVVAAKDGERALQMAQQLPPPDIILLDVMMPNMDGFEVCERLKADPATSGIPVIFVTALTEDVSEQRGFNVGAVDYITKPFSPPTVRARVRTHLQLKQAQLTLEEQNRKLVEAAKTREEVERIMQHDLKGPLTTIIGMPSLLLKKGNITEQQKISLTLINDAGELMLQMINNHLNLYKMEMGTYTYRPQPLDLIPIMHKVFTECENVAAAYGISIELNLPPQQQAFFVSAEPLLTHSMLSNLLKNAVEASPRGHKVEVTLTLKEERPVVVIHNAGAVPEAIRENFFDKYTTAGKDGGTGIGTYSANLAARTQGGHLAMETSEETGTTITAYFTAA